MVKALEVVDGVGLGRPSAAEFRLSSDLLEGKVTSAILPAMDQDDEALAIVVAGTQMRQVGRDQQPIDVSTEESMQAFLKDKDVWAQKKEADTEGKEYGFVDLSGPAQPYLA